MAKTTKRDDVLIVDDDADVLLAGLDVRPGDVCLSIASAGDNALALLTANPSRVIALDVSAAQLACLELRAAAYRTLSHPELLELMGSRRSTRRLELFDRARPRLKIGPAPAAPVSDARAFMFDVLLASNRLADAVFAADKQAVTGREFYDDGYFASFEQDQFSALQQRVNDSITAVASVILGAWDAAGRPAIPPDSPRLPRAVRRPRG